MYVKDEEAVYATNNPNKKIRRTRNQRGHTSGEQQFEEFKNAEDNNEQLGINSP